MQNLAILCFFIGGKVPPLENVLLLKDVFRQAQFAL